MEPEHRRLSRFIAAYRPDKMGRYAWHVTIYKMFKEPLLICGGTIISSRMILTGQYRKVHNSSGITDSHNHFQVSMTDRTYIKIPTLPRELRPINMNRQIGIGAFFVSMEITIFIENSDRLDKNSGWSYVPHITHFPLNEELEYFDI